MALQSGKKVIHAPCVEALVTNCKSLILHRAAVGITAGRIIVSWRYEDRCSHSVRGGIRTRPISSSGVPFWVVGLSDICFFYFNEALLAFAV